MTSLLSPENPMLLFGCGNMGRAMLDGWLRAGFEPACFVVVDPHASNLPEGVPVFPAASHVKRHFSLALLAVKPQIFGGIASAFEALLAPDAWILSLLAGTPTDTLQASLPGRSIVRVMPNLAAAIGKSPIGLYSKADGDHAAVETLMVPLGSPSWVDDEALMDAVTALAGSGPAFVYRFIDALAKAGAEMGLDAEQSLQLAKAMVVGAAELAASQQDTPEELARRVTSPGGTTAAGLAVLDANDALQKLVAATLSAARDRGIALSKG